MNAASWKQFLLSPNGRVRRYAYNMFYLASFVIVMIAFGFDYLAYGQAALQKDGPQPFSNAANLLLLWPTIVLTIKRLHDLNRSGWWTFAGFFGPVMLAMVAAVLAIPYLVVMGQNPETLPGLAVIVIGMGMVSMFVMVAFFIILSIRKGTTGPNRFGADPLQNPFHENILVSEGV